MAQLPVYRQQGNITTQPTGQVRDLDTFAQGAKNMQSAGNMLFALSAKWQESKDAVENLDGKNKLNSGIAAILDEASNYNDYSTPEELSQKQNELTQKMNELVPNIVGGFSNNQTAREFEANGQFATQQNIYKLQAIFRDKYGDMYNANLMETGDSALKSFTLTGDENYKKEYFDAIETGVKAGYLDRTQAEKLKLSTDEWNYDYVYSKTLENPYFKASDEIMSKIDPVKQRTLRNFARAEQKRAQAEAIQQATNDYYLNPTQANLNRLYKANPKLRGSKQLNSQFENVKNRTPNYEAVTSYDSMKDALNATKELAMIDVSTPQGKRTYAQKAAEVGNAINKMQKDGTISEKDRSKLFNMVYKDLMDDNFKNQIKGMPDLAKEGFTEYVKGHNKLGAELYNAEQEVIKYSKDKNSQAYKQAEAKRQQLLKTKNTYIKMYDDIRKNRFNNAPLSVMQRVTTLQRQASENMLKAYMSGDINAANKIKEQYGNDIVRLKYWNIPALQKQNLKAGDKFTVNGKVYSYQGFSKNDVIVEVH